MASRRSQRDTEDARQALEDILSDEPDWAGLFYVKPVELNGWERSLN